MKSKTLKIIIAILIFVTLILLFSQNSFALNYDISNKFEGTSDKGNATNTVSVILGKTINAFQVAGAGIAIVMIVVLGIRWIGASPSGKAQMMKSIKYYVAGAIFIFAAIALLQIIKNFVKGSVNSQF